MLDCLDCTVPRQTGLLHPAVEDAGLVLNGILSGLVQGLPRPGRDLGHRGRHDMARLLELEQAVVADRLELLLGLLASIAQRQQGAAADLDMVLVDGPPGPVQCLFRHMDDDVMVGAGVLGALDDHLLDAGDDLGRGVVAGMGYLVEHSTVALVANAGEDRDRQLADRAPVRSR